jgi:6-phosphogluconolactonase (cycloisomerase 2 family)
MHRFLSSYSAFKLLPDDGNLRSLLGQDLDGIHMISNNLIVFLLTAIISGMSAQSTYLFVGTYTEGKPGEGIYVYSFHPHSGKCKLVSSVDSIINPSYLSLSHDGRFLYACTDTKMPIPGNVTAFRIDSVKGRLHFINKQPCGGENPVYVAVHNDDHFVACANYTGGSASIFPIQADGSIAPYVQLIPFTGSSINPQRQDKPYIHAAVFSPKGDYLFLPDLGADQIRVLKFAEKSNPPLIPVEGKNVHSIPGSGPRHVTFHPNQRFAYCVEELSGMISAYTYKDGELDSIQRIFSYSQTWDSYASADIHISPDGRFLYASNRLHDENTISIFSIQQENGKLTLIGHQKTGGDHPRNFTLDPTGNYLLVANLATDNIVIFKRNKETGLLTKTKKEITVPRPSCLQMRTYHH